MQNGYYRAKEPDGVEVLVQITPVDRLQQGPLHVIRCRGDGSPMSDATGNVLPFELLSDSKLTGWDGPIKLDA